MDMQSGVASVSIEKVTEKPARRFRLGWKLFILLTILVANAVVIMMLTNVTLAGKVLLVLVSAGIAALGVIPDDFMNRIGRRLTKWDDSL